MIIIATVDDRYGMMFNKRRLSQDKNLREYILDLTRDTGKKLWMNAYTYALFKDIVKEEQLIIAVDEDFLAKASEGELCYVENCPLKSYENRIEKIVLCFWNRRYPSDTYWDIDMNNYLLSMTEELIGSSHEKITINWYVAICRL